MYPVCRARLDPNSYPHLQELVNDKHPGKERSCLQFNMDTSLLFVGGVRAQRKGGAFSPSS